MESQVMTSLISIGFVVCIVKGCRSRRGSCVVMEMAKIFEELKPQEAYIKLAHYWHWQRGFRRLKFRTVTLHPHHAFPFIQTLRNYYAKTLLTPIAHLSDTISASLTPLPATRNRINF